MVNKIINFMILRKSIIILAAATLAITASAQQSEHANYFGVNFGGGLNTMLYQPANGNHGMGLGFDAGLHYGHFFNHTVGLGLGIQYTWANAYATYSWQEVTPNLTHPSNPNTPYTLTTDFQNFKERQNMGILSIPVEVLFRKAFNDRAAFIGGFGVQLDLPLYGNYINKGGQYTTTGVFPELGSYVISNMPEHGFSTYTTTREAKINNRAKVGGSVIADLGVRIALNDNWGMYIGAYAGYGFTNLLKEQKVEELVMINTADPSNIDYRGTFDSNQTKKANLLRAGLKIAFDFGWPAMKAAKSEPVMAADPELLVRQQNMRDSIAALQAENARLAAEAEQARAAANSEAARLAAEEAARLAAEKAEAERLAAEKARFDALKAKGQTIAVHFETAGAKMNIQPDEKAVLDDVCHLMANDPSVRIVIYGHTDNTGNAEQNLKYFGLKRAEALRDYMVSQGVSADQIRCESKGQTEPVGDNATKEGRALNRRANIRFL